MNALMTTTVSETISIMLAIFICSIGLLLMDRIYLHTGVGSFGKLHSC